MLLVSVPKTCNTQVLLLFIFLLSHLSLKYAFAMRCNHEMYSTGCPSFATCNKVIGMCYCKPEFLTFGLCSEYRQLGQKCFHSYQCRKTLNAVCYDKKFNELSNTSKWSHGKLIQEDYKDKFDLYGECKCRIGYKMSAENKCKETKLKDILCNNTLDCSLREKNTYCNRDTKKCSCSYPYTYDSDIDRCIIDSRGSAFNSNIRKKDETNSEFGLWNIEDIFGYVILGMGIIVILFKCTNCLLASLRTEPAIEVNVQIANSTGLQTATENDLNEYDSRSMICPPPYDIVSTDQQLPTYEQAILLAQIQVQKE